MASTWESRDDITAQDLILMLDRSGFEVVETTEKYDYLRDNLLRYGDILLIGEDHSGIVDFFKRDYGSSDTLKRICHFRGSTQWPGGKPKRSSVHGIFCVPNSELKSHILGKHKTPKETYGHRKATLVRSIWAGGWKSIHSIYKTSDGETGEDPGAKNYIVLTEVVEINKGTLKLAMKVTNEKPPTNIAQIEVDLTKPNTATGIFLLDGLPSRFSIGKDSNGKYRLNAKLAMESESGAPPYDHWYLVLTKIQN